MAIEQREADIGEMGRSSDVHSSDPKVGQLHDHGDKALHFLENQEAVTYTAEEEKNVIRKIDRVLMPLVSSLLVPDTCFFSLADPSAIDDHFVYHPIHGQKCHGSSSCL